MDGLKHKDGCLPKDRKHDVISPVLGLRCRNCGAERDAYKDMMKLLKHCKMYIVDGKGYAGTVEEELALIKNEFEKLGL